MAGWKDYIRRVEPYTPGEQPKQSNIIKLNTNENPYGPSPVVCQVRENMDDLRLYPDPSAGMLVESLARYHGVDADQVFVGVGSDDVLAMAFLTFFNSDKAVLFPDISYSFYPVWAELFRIPYEKQPLDASFRLVKEDYYKENGGVVFPNPNAPTGIYEPLDFIEDILQHNPDSVVIIDEAYIDFAGESALSLLADHDNLLVVRTFSKSRSMAGLRIGYAIGNPELILAMNDVKYSYNSYTMNRPSLILGTKVLEDEAYFQSVIRKIITTREWFGNRLKELGFTFPESGSNFIFATHKTVPARELFDAAKEHGIYIRYFDQPRIDNYLRITIGTDEEMQRLVDFFEEYLK